jgi:stage V sporulation protein G
MSTFRLSEVCVTPIKPSQGLVAFASFVINDSLYCGSVGIVTRPGGGYRLVYPSRLVSKRQLNIFHPISNEIGQAIQSAVIHKYEEVLNHGRNRHDSLDARVE